MVEELGNFILAAFLAGAAATIPPGTIFTMTVAETFRHGFRGGFLVIVGHAVVEVAVVLMLATGLGILLGSEAARTALGLLGGGVLLWMGYDTARLAYRGGLTPAGEASNVGYSAYSPLGRGFVACVLNPYFILWWATVGGAFIVRGFSLFGWMSPIVFLLCHWASDFPWFTLISHSIGKGRRFLKEKTYRATVGVCGGLMLILGLSFLKDGVELLLSMTS